MVGRDLNLLQLLDDCERSNDAAAWDRLVRAMQPLVVRMVVQSARRLGHYDSALVQDLSQDALLKLCRNQFAILRKVSGQPEEMVRAYIKVVVANLVHDHFRSQWSAKRSPEGGFADTADLEDRFVDDTFVDASEREMLLGEIDGVLRRELPADNRQRDRRIFWLHHRHGMSAGAICGLPGVGLSVKGVESLLYRLRALVKKNLGIAKGVSR